ncbi:hypothetical protein F2P79_019104 [Pimephales promelas]|nr:hypothetical protein F2P79_019104 [Pimephales promelas]
MSPALLSFESLLSIFKTPPWCLPWTEGPHQGSSSHRPFESNRFRRIRVICPGSLRSISICEWSSAVPEPHPFLLITLMIAA